MKYRIKTEKEFIKEFGKYWRNNLEWYFSIDMDYLLGTTVTSNELPLR